MPQPYHIRKALGQYRVESVPDGECEGAKFHSPTPLSVRQVRIGGREVPMCAVCEDNLDVYLVLMSEAGGELAWPVRREFGNQLRALAQEEWEHDG